MGQKRKLGSLIAVPHFGHGGAADAVTGASSFTPQYAQNGSEVSTSWPHALHVGAAPPAVGPPDG
ncbi:MAG: hypothetical protein AAB409_00115 [Gemmatimonadota bacterium]